MSFMHDDYYTDMPKMKSIRSRKTEYSEAPFNPMNMSARRTYSPIGSDMRKRDDGDKKYREKHSKKNDAFEKFGAPPEPSLYDKVNHLKDRLKMIEASQYNIGGKESAEDISLGSKVDFLRDRLLNVESRLDGHGGNAPIGFKPGGPSTDEKVEYLRDKLRALEARNEAPPMAPIGAKGGNDDLADKVEYLRDKLRALEERNEALPMAPIGAKVGDDLVEKVEYLRDKLRALEARSDGSGMAPIGFRPGGGADDVHEKLRALEAKIDSVSSTELATLGNRLNFIRDKMHNVERKVDGIPDMIKQHVMDDDGIHVNEKLSYIRDKLRSVENANIGSKVGYHDSNMRQLRDDVDKIKSVMKQNTWKDPFDA